MEGNNMGLGVVNKRRNMKGGKTKVMLKKMKKRRSNRVIRGILKYLKSDSYFYSPLISPLPSYSSGPPDFVSSSSSPGSESNEPILQNEGKLKEKVMKYLKSDTYLYTPFEDIQHPQNVSVKTVISPTNGHTLTRKTVASTILSRKITLQEEQLARESAREKQGDKSSKVVAPDASVLSPHTPGLQEVKKRVVRRSYRLSMSAGH